MPEQRQKLSYKGADIIAAFWKGDCQAAVHGRSIARKTFKGATLEDAIDQAKGYVDDILRSREVRTTRHGEYLIVASYESGKFRATATRGSIRFSTTDDIGLEGAINALVHRIDTEPNLIAKVTQENHNRFLEKQGMPSGALRSSEKPFVHRMTHCWACKHPLDNMVQFECPACGWIVCGCGACGCAPSS